MSIADRLDAVYEGLNALLEKHGFEKLVLYDADINEPFHSYALGVCDIPTLLLMSCSHKQVCPCCAEQEGEE